MIKTTVSIIKNEEIANNIYNMEFKSKEIADEAKAGQFLEIYLKDKSLLLPRPISICDVKNDVIKIVYHVVGKGTDYMSKLKIADEIDVVGSLGNGFAVDEAKNCKNVAVIGGGIGVPPMLMLGKSILNNSKAKVTAYLGYRSETFLTENFVNEKMQVEIATDDGSSGFKGNVLDKLKANVNEDKNNLPDIIFACGPKIMLKAIYEYASENNIKTYVSMEERMACGFGACVGCAIKVNDDNNENNWVYKKVCKDGPVFLGEEVVWNE